jgi:repressor LexA
MGWGEDLYERFDNILPISIKRVPILGDIACGEPIYAEEEHESFAAVNSSLDADFCLRAKGDSMVGARIYDGDIVFIRSQAMVDNGEIAAVIIDDEATLKRVYFYPDEGKLILSPENPRYAPLVYFGNQLESIKIMGKAVAFQSSVI